MAKNSVIVGLNYKVSANFFNLSNSFLCQSVDDNFLNCIQGVFSIQEAHSRWQTLEAAGRHSSVFSILFSETYYNNLNLSVTKTRAFSGHALM